MLSWLLINSLFLCFLVHFTRSRKCALVYFIKTTVYLCARWPSTPHEKWFHLQGNQTLDPWVPSHCKQADMLLVMCYITQTSTECFHMLFVWSQCFFFLFGAHESCAHLLSLSKHAVFTQKWDFVIFLFFFLSDNVTSLKILS